MNVLVIGSGGREHALAYKISESKRLDKLFIMPGNTGTKALGTNVNINLNEHEAIYSFCLQNKIELVVIGPEQPLVDGISDYLRERGINVFGPSSKAAAIEAQKSFAKWLMIKYNIPTAAYKEFNLSGYELAKEYIFSQKFPCVIKADGLAAGKGVIICNNAAEAFDALENIFGNKIFGHAGDKIIIEEFMSGEEASIFAITDGSEFVCLPAAQDHKRIGDNDTGKNTGGMGAYCPAPLITPLLMDLIEKKIIIPTINAMAIEGRKFIGCLYCGLMITSEGPKVVEFNCRFGDPETQAVLPVLEGDFLQLLYSAALGTLDKTSVKYNNGAAVCVVAASKGYPDSYEKGFEISGLDSLDKDIVVFHAGTKDDGNKILTNGGRVLGVTAVVEKPELKTAKQKAYQALEKITFNGMYFRSDIADRAIYRKH